MSDHFPPSKSDIGTKVNILASGNETWHLLALPVNMLKQVIPHLKFHLGIAIKSFVGMNGMVYYSFTQR